MVGERLKHYRTQRSMSQEALAEAMGFPPNTISKIEHGTRKVTFEEAVRFAEILDISLPDLAGMTEAPVDADDVKAIAHECAQKVREAATALTAATHMADHLERAVSAF